VLFECLTGEPPFPGRGEAATLYAHLEETPTKPSARRPGVPTGLDIVVQKAMSKRPDWRQTSAGELASEARAAIGQSFPEARSERSRRGMWGMIAAAAALVVLAAIVVVASAGSDETPPTSGDGTAGLALRQGLLAVDPAGGAAIKKIPGQLGVGPFGVSTNLAAGEGALWTTNLSGPIRVDPSTGDVSELPVSQCGFGVRSAIGLGDAWIVCGARGDQAFRVDPFSLKAREISITGAEGSGLPGGAGIAAGALWTCWGPLYRVDALTEEVDGPVPGVTADFCAVGEGSVWAVDQVRSTVTPVDPNTPEVGHAIAVPGDIDELAVGAGGVWVLDRSAGTVTRIDPRTGAVGAAIGIGEGARSLATGFGDVWVTMPADRDLVKIDPLTREATRMRVDAAATLVAADPASGSLWLVAVPPGSLD
jgi:streptogramin lyase